MARTLPASFYGDAGHHEREIAAVFERGWSCVGITDDVAAPGSYVTVAVGGKVPVVVVRGDDGELRAFQNVCRHRGSPVAEGCGVARVLQCPYHAWIYKLDGSLSKAVGTSVIEGFDRSELGLLPVSVAVWDRFVFVHLDPQAPPLDLGPLAAAIEPYRFGEYEPALREHSERTYNWKLFVENYSENFHTPFVHPQLGGLDWEYPIVADGKIALAWDRPTAPRNAVERALATSRPGEAGWAQVAIEQVDETFLAGVYLTVFPNLLISMFPRYGHALILTPLGPRTTRIDYVRCWRSEVDAARRAADHAAAVEVGDQDLDICERVQRTYDGGLDPHGILVPGHEDGVAHVHRLVLDALATLDA